MNLCRSDYLLGSVSQAEDGIRYAQESRGLGDVYKRQMWRPKDPYNYFGDDPLGNISAVGAYKSDIAGITTLRGLYETGRFDATCMLTNTIHVFPSTISSAGGLATVERDVVLPLQSLRASGQVEITNFTALAATWKSRFGGKACVYQE